MQLTNWYVIEVNTPVMETEMNPVPLYSIKEVTPHATARYLTGL